MDSKEIEKRRIAFDDYSRRDDNGTEYWSARDIMKPLGYSRWENFNEAIKRAIISCETSKTPVECHFREVTKMVQSGVAKRVERRIKTEEKQLMKNTEGFKSEE